MTDFTVWAFAWAAALVLASALVWAASAHGMDEPTGRHRAGYLPPIPVELAGFRKQARSRPQYAICSGIRQPIPVHVVARTIQPAWEPVREPVATYTRQAAEQAAAAREQRALRAQEQPRLTGGQPVQVVPLWVAYAEQHKQAARRQALNAAAAGLPDPGYTYPGAHSLARAVA